VVPPREALISVAPTAWSGLARELAQVMDAAVAGAEEHLRDLGRLLRHTRRSVAAEVRRGAPAEQIIAAAEQHGADLIIMGSHGEGDVDRWLLGSVSERIARYARCSVLVVH
jgi:nucleotide-binding universal stress UspA family protein